MALEQAQGLRGARVCQEAVQGGELGLQLLALQQLLVHFLTFAHPISNAAVEEQTF